MHVAIIWQRFLPYHVARIKHLNQKLHELGHTLSAIEVATQDLSYGFPETLAENGFSSVCCFPGSLYHQHTAKEIHNKVLDTLYLLKPDVVFAPATPFPEGMASIAYRLYAGKRSVLMDDAWEHSDRRGGFIKWVKGLAHLNVDAAFVPAISHLSYYCKMGFPSERIVYGVDVVDNDFFFLNTDKIREKSSFLRKSKNLPDRYFLFVGRFLARKGLETLIEAYRIYKGKMKQDVWNLILVGEGGYLNKIREMARDFQEVQFVGSKYGEELCQYYGLATAAIIPSELDPWGLVVNEAMASGLPVIVSQGCGSANTLVKESENGWTFEVGNAEELSRLMLRISALAPSTLKRMGIRSREIIRELSLDKFAEGVLKAMDIPRRPSAGLVSNMLIRFWKGHIRVN